jgi:hypothetical protein
MKSERRRSLTNQSFEEKIRKVGELIRLSRNVKAQRAREDTESYSQSDLEFTRPSRRGGPRKSKT